MEGTMYSSREFEIEPRVWALADGTFGISAHIWRHEGSRSSVTQFNAKNTGPSGISVGHKDSGDS